MTTKPGKDEKSEKEKRPSLIRKFAEKYGVDDEKMLETFKKTAFRQSGTNPPEITNEQMMALLIVADLYSLNPFTKEIYAYPDKGGIVPVVSVDGWVRIVNEHPMFNGFEFGYSEEMSEGEGDERPSAHDWMSVTFFRKDTLGHPVTIREYFDEVYRKPVTKQGNNGPYTITGPWQTHPKRMHRHKTFIQGARVAFGFAGIYDDDEADRIISDSRVVASVPGNRTQQAKENLKIANQSHRPGDELLRPTVKPVEKVPVEKPEQTDEQVYQWEDESDLSHWAGVFKGVFKSAEELREAWDRCVTQFTAANREIPLEVEAPYQLARERFQ